ncbi:MAG TPA: glutamate racemase [Acholeplasmataceae bacterium]|nr:glutamate racemase [Acholeplasmataceae bacterium]
MDKNAIGVFDSGVGGLTVLSDLIDHFPNENFIYLADTKNNPYGLKTKEELESIVSTNVNYFINENVKAIVIACNTASANSYHLKTNIPIIRIIEPTAKYAQQIGKNILVLATDYTISSGIYQHLLNKATGVKCSKFVGIVEKGMMGTKDSYEIVERVLSKYKGKYDTIILGCTHFGLLKDEIISVLGNVNIVDSSLTLSPILNNYIKLNSQKERGKVIINTTGNPKDLKIDWFKKKYDKLSQIILN